MKNVTNYILRSNGEEFAHAFKVQSIMVLHEVNKISRAKITLIDGDVSEQDFKLSAMDFFVPGNTFEVDIGFENDVENVFKGILTRHAIKVIEENKTTLDIECKHEAVKLAHSKRNRFFYNKSDKTLVQQILEDSDILFTIDNWQEYNSAQTVQGYTTDWDFILSRAENCGVYIFPQGENLIIGAPDIDQEEIATCTYGRNVLEFEAAMNNEWQTPKVEAKAWSPTIQEILTEQGGSSFINALGNIDAKTLASVWGDQVRTLQYSGSLNGEALSALSNAEATKNELSKIVGRVRIKGDHRILPGKTIKLEGFGARFGGKALVTGIRHELQEGNWTTDVQFGLNTAQILPAKERAALKGCHIAVVTQLEQDPEGNYRVKVKLPLLDSEEDGIWARMAQAYAGNNYGFFFYPEIGDEVVVGFFGEDVDYAIILGALYSSARPAPKEVTDNNFIKGITTKNGLKMTFDDEKKTIALETPSGNTISLNEEEQSITITDEHSNKWAMTSDGISLESNKKINLKASQDITIEGLNISLRASAKLVAEGTSGADFKSGAIAVLKGSLVQIN